MSGYDAPFHLSEECSNANVASPRAIVMTAGFGGLAGWALQLVTAYTVQDIPGAIGSTLGQPWAAYLIQVVPQSTALAIIALTFICGFSMGQGCMVAASRVTFAYARDGCFPASFWIKRVNKTTLTPVNAVWFNTSIGICLLFLIFGGPLAIGAIFSVGAIAAYVAFTIPIFIRVFLVGNRFRRGPWHLGKFSRPIGALGCSFVLVMMPILCFPAFRDGDLTTAVMNWTCVVYGGPYVYLYEPICGHIY
jgi:amino acid transporter